MHSEAEHGEDGFGSAPGAEPDQWRPYRPGPVGRPTHLSVSFSRVVDERQLHCEPAVFKTTVARVDFRVGRPSQGRRHLSESARTTGRLGSVRSLWSSGPHAITVSGGPLGSARLSGEPTRISSRTPDTYSFIRGICSAHFSETLVRILSPSQVSESATSFLCLVNHETSLSASRP